MLIRGVLAALAVGLSASVSSAITADWTEVDNHGLIPGYRTFDLVVDTGEPFSAAAMLFELTEGTFYQHPMGEISILNPAFFSIFPALEFDTCLMDDGDPINVLGAGGDVGGDSPRFDETELDVSWQNQGFPPEHQGSVRIARVSISDGAVGSWRLYVIEFGLADRGLFSGTVADIVPEPGAWCLFAATSLGLTRRRQTAGPAGAWL